MAVTLVHTNADLAATISGSENAFVPTMGALHEGHLALIRRATECGRPVVISIFVNPSQFAPGEDFDRYPRTLEADIPLAEQAGADVIYAPSVEEVYPPGAELVVPPLPDVATRPGLEDACRPGHFAGVCRVVSRLFDIVCPRWAVFGEKDYQQLLVIQAMVDQQNRRGDQPTSERWPNLEIISHPTVRDSDGLAMSSRNRYLTEEDRHRALGLSRALDAAVRSDTPARAEATMKDVLTSNRLAVDYAAIRDAKTLQPIESFDRPARALIAARLDHVRLIDNRAIRGTTTDDQAGEEQTQS